MSGADDTKRWSMYLRVRFAVHSACEAEEALTASEEESEMTTLAQREYRRGDCNKRCDDSAELVLTTHTQ
jgi:hypothetical protein